MRVAGFTIVRNMVQFGYPFLPSIRSALPLCDIFFIGVGDSQDRTLEIIENLKLKEPKIQILPSVWNESLKKGGTVLGQETNKLLAKIYATHPEIDYLLYLQADEVLHEKDLTGIEKAMLAYKEEPRVEGLLFSYHHFYGSYDYVGDSRVWYRKEIRIIKNNLQIQSYKDAQGFRRGGKKLRVKEIPAHIYHYGWVKDPLVQLEKRIAFESLYGVDTSALKARIMDEKTKGYAYGKEHSVRPFLGTHPAFMESIVGAKRDWEFTPDRKRKFENNWHRLLYYLEQCTGRRWFEYKNYIRI